jgi:orotate phosphoribosyltransferase
MWLKRGNKYRNTIPVNRNQAGWILQYRQNEALWIHDGNRNRPHALLTSGMHSNGFFNSRLVIPDEVLLRDAASDLLELFAQNGGDVSKVQGVVGPQTGATKLAEFISHQISAFNRDECFSASPAKKESAGQKSMVFSNEDLEIIPGQSILLCEDVLTTGSSVGLAETAVVNAGGTVLPFILVLVNRSGLAEVSGKKIIALIDRALPMWTPEECPLCREGSKAIRPKDKHPEDNWAALNQTVGCRLSDVNRKTGQHPSAYAPGA